MARWKFWAVAFAFLVVMMFATLPSPLYGLYRTRDHLSAFMITVVFAIFAGGTIITLLGERSIAARFGRRGAMLAGVATMMVAAGLLAVWKDLPGLLIGRLLTGVAIGLAAGVAIAYLIELRLRVDPNASPVPARNIGTAVNVGALGIGPLLAGCLAQWAPYPLTLPYLLMVALGAVALIGLAAAPETGTPVPRAAAPSRPAVRRAGSGFQFRRQPRPLRPLPRRACSRRCPDSSWPPPCIRPHMRCPGRHCSWCSRQEWCPSWQRTGCGRRACSRSARSR